MIKRISHIVSTLQHLVSSNYGKHTVTGKVMIARSAVIFDAAEYRRTHILTI